MTEISNLRAEIVAQNQIFMDQLDLHTVRITAAQDDADSATALAYSALGQLYQVGLESRTYTDDQLQLLRDDVVRLAHQIGAEAVSTAGSNNESALASLNPDLRQLLEDTIGAVNAIANRLGLDLSEFTDLYEFMVDEELPQLRDAVTVATTVATGTRVMVDGVLAGYEYNTVVEGFDKALMDTINTALPLQSSALRLPAALWTTSSTSLSFSSKVPPANDDFVTNDPILGECYAFPSGDRTIGPAYPLDIDPSKIFYLRARVRVTDNGLTGSVRFTFGAATWAAGFLIESDVRSDEYIEVVESEGEYTLGCYMTANADYVVRAREQGSPVIDLSINSRNAIHVFPFLRQNDSSATSGRSSISVFETLDVTEVFSTSITIFSKIAEAQAYAESVQQNLEDAAASLTVDYNATQLAAQAAKDAKDLAVSARNLAEDYRDASQVARTGSETAKGLAETARNQANSAAADALQSSTAANTAKGQAETFATQASTSASDAAGFSSSASTAAGVAASAKDDAEDAATAASTSASQASSSATTASQQASAANASATTAQTARGEAQTFRNEAASSATDALGSANTATTQAGIATTAKNNAASSASAASTSASQASSSATTASQQASAANTSRINAETASGAASVSAGQAASSATTAQGHAQSAANSSEVSVKTVRDTLPSNFEQDSLYWTHFLSSNPDLKPDVISAVSFVDTPRGRAACITFPIGGNAIIATKGVFKAQVGRTYRLKSVFRSAIAGPSPTLRIAIRGNASDYTNSVNLLSQTVTTGGVGEWITGVYEYTPSQNLTHPLLIPFVYCVPADGASGAKIEVLSISLEDITSEKAAENSAAASASSASSAALKETEAGQHAASALSDATAAQTARGQAQTFANQASSSKTDAAGSASTATTQAGLATTAKNNAAASASAASTSAGQASASATAASQQASAANQHRIDADTARGAAVVARNTAVQSATDAADSAQEAGEKLVLAAQTVAQGTGLIADPYFDKYGVVGWYNFNTGPTIVANEVYSQGKTLTFNVTSAQNAGCVFSSSSIWKGPTNQAHYVVEITFTLESGSLEGSLFRIDWNRSTTEQVAHGSLSDMLGFTPVLGQTYTVSKIVARPQGPENFTSHDVWFFANYATQGETKQTKNLKLHRYQVRTATPEELGGGVVGSVIDAAVTVERNARTSATDAITNTLNSQGSRIGTAEGTITQQGITLATLDGKAQASAGLTAETTSAGGVTRISGIKATSFSDPDGSGGSLLELIGDNVVAKGTLSFDKLVSGASGANQVTNGAFNAGLAGWYNGGVGASAGETTLSVRTAGSTFAGLNYPTLMARQNGASNDGYFDVLNGRYTASGANSARVFSVKQGERYGAAVKLSLHRCTAQLYIFWRDTNGAFVGAAGGGTLTGGQYSSSNPEEWPLYWIQGTVPSGAAFGQFVLRKMGTDVGSSDSYMFIHKPYTFKSHADATEPPPWTPEGMSLLHGGTLINDTVETRHLKAGAVTTDKVDTDSFSASGLAVFGGSLQSPGFSVGQSGMGWRIQNDGNAIFNNVIVRDSLVVGSVSDGATMSLFPGGATFNSTGSNTISLGAWSFDNFWTLSWSGEYRNKSSITWQTTTSQGEIVNNTASISTELYASYRTRIGTTWSGWIEVGYSGRSTSNVWKSYNVTQIMSGTFDEVEMRMEYVPRTEGLNPPNAYYGTPQTNVRRVAAVGRAITR